MVKVLDEGLIQALERFLGATEGKGSLIRKVGLVKEKGKWNCLGEGNTAKVYEAADRFDSKRRYALKISVGREAELTRAMKNLMIQKRLSAECENIVKVYDVWMLYVGKDENGDYCVTEFPNRYDGGKYLRILLVLLEKQENVLSINEAGKMTFLNKRDVSENEVIEFGLQIGQAVLKLHDERIMHGDIKLENIYYDRMHNCYKLGDFDGVIREGEEDVAIACKSVGYSMPDMKKQQKRSFSIQTDSYSLGMCMYLLLNRLCFPFSDGYYESGKRYRYSLPFPAPVNASRKMVKLIKRMFSSKRVKTIEQILKELIKIKSRM